MGFNRSLPLRGSRSSDWILSIDLDQLDLQLFGCLVGKICQKDPRTDLKACNTFGGQFFHILCGVINIHYQITSLCLR